MPAAKRREVVACVTREAARQLNRTLPRRIDRSTTAQRIVADGTTLTYHYRGDMRVADPRPGAFEAYARRLRVRLCGASTRAMIDMGAGCRMIWTDRDGARIGELFFDRC